MDVNRIIVGAFALTALAIVLSFPPVQVGPEGKATPADSTALRGKTHRDQAGWLYCERGRPATITA